MRTLIQTYVLTYEGGMGGIEEMPVWAAVRRVRKFERRRQFSEWGEETGRTGEPIPGHTSIFQRLDTSPGPNRSHPHLMAMYDALRRRSGERGGVRHPETSYRHANPRDFRVRENLGKPTCLCIIA